MEKGAINISANSTILPEAVLSNFFDSPISLFGKLYRSVESFWQAIKFPEGSEERDKVSRMTGWEAKNYIKKAGIHTDVLILNGEQIIVGSERHKELMKIALEAKFSHPALAKILQDTGDAEITHILVDSSGKEHADSLSMPRDVFCGFIKAIRQDLKNKTLSVPLSEAMLIRSKHAVLPIKRVKGVMNEILDEGVDTTSAGTVDGAMHKLRTIMKNRDAGIKAILKENGVDISGLFGIYGDVVLSRVDVDKIPDSELKDFILNETYNQVGTTKISSRGRGYYFNLKGLSENAQRYEIDVNEFYTEFLNYFEKIITLLNLARLTDANSSKSSLIFLTDHLRNILLFLKFQVLTLTDPENLKRILPVNMVDGKGKLIIDQLIEKGLLAEVGIHITQAVDDIILQVEDFYCKILLGEPVKESEFEFSKTVVEVIELLQSTMLGISKEFSAYKKFFSKLIVNTFRTSREADNPIKSIYAALNFIATNDYELRQLPDIQIVGIPYGGMEIPYILKNLLKQIYPDKTVYIDFLIMPPLSYRGLKPFSLKENDLKSSNVILVDDNINSGNTTLYAQGLLAQYTTNFFHMVVEGTESINPISISVYDTICGFVPQDKGSNGYRNRLGQYLRRRGILGRV